MARRCLIAAAVCIASAANHANAAERVYEVRKGDTLAALARHFYGASWAKAYISTRNSLGEEPPAPGKRLLIPETWTYKVKAGEALGSVAKKFLGDVRRYPVLMEANGIKNAADVAAGRMLIMPFHLRYAVQKGDTPASIAKTFYRSSEFGRWITTYNGIKDVRPGMRVTVPIFDRNALEIKTKGAPPAQTSQQGPASHKAEPAKAEPGPLDLTSARKRFLYARNKLRDGFFGEACGVFEKLQGAGLPDTMRASVFKHLGICAVAFADARDARRFFVKWIKMVPDANFDSVRTSPKILAAFKDAKETLAATLDD